MLTDSNPRTEPSTIQRSNESRWTRPPKRGVRINTVGCRLAFDPVVRVVFPTPGIEGPAAFATDALDPASRSVESTCPGDEARPELFDNGASGLVAALEGAKIADSPAKAKPDAAQSALAVLEMRSVSNPALPADASPWPRRFNEKNRQVFRAVAGREFFREEVG